MNRKNEAGDKAVTNEFKRKAAVALELVLIVVGICLIFFFLTRKQTIWLEASYEQGRYTVSSGEKANSDTNIRSTEYIPVTGGATLNLQIPEGYSVTVHQFMTESSSGFLESQSGLTGTFSLKLNEKTRYIHLSIKKRNNAAIDTSEGDSITANYVFSYLSLGESANPSWESGRYAVETGRVVESDNNIRSRNFIEAVGQRIQMNIPPQYSITVHQYREASFYSFLTSRSGLKGETSFLLEEDARYIQISMKKTDNSVISPDAGDLLSISFSKPIKMLTIIDDDGDERYYTQIYPIAKRSGVSVSAAVPASFPGKSGCMTWEMIEECRDNGMEILFHTFSHPLSSSIAEMTEEDFFDDYEKGKALFQEHGLSADLLVFSGSTGLYEKAQNPAHRLFAGAFLAGDNQTNQPGFDPYRIKRYRIGSDYSYDIEVLKELIDSLDNNGGWMVWMMHTSDNTYYTPDAPQILEEAIEYCKEKEIPIVSAEYGFNQFET